MPPRKKQGFSWVLPCKDGFVSFSPFTTDHWWGAFKEMMGQPGWAQSDVFDTAQGRNDNADALEPLTIEWLAERSKAEIYELAMQHGIPCFPVNSMSELLGSRQYRARDFFVEVEHPVAGTLTQPGPPVRYSKAPATIREPAPQLGAHTEDVLGGLLGLTRQELTTLAQSGAT